MVFNVTFNNISVISCSWLIDIKSVRSISYDYFVQSVMVCNQQILPSASSQLTMRIHWPCYCIVHVCYFFVIVYMWSVLVEVDLRIFFILHLYMYIYCHWRSNYQGRKVVIPLTGLTTPHCCACPKARIWISNVICHVFFMFKSVLWG